MKVYVVSFNLFKKFENLKNYKNLASLDVFQDLKILVGYLI